MTDWLSSDGWGTREQAIPGEWAMLVLIIVAGGAVGFLVLWFTMLRHERTVLYRARARSELESEFFVDGRGRESGTSTSPLFGLESIAEADDPADDASADEAAGAEAAEAETAEPEAEEQPEEHQEAEDEPAEADAAPEAEAEPEGELEPESEREPEAENEPENEPVNEPEPAASVASTDVPAVILPAAAIALPKGQRKLSNEMLSRVEREMAERAGWRWKDLATLVQREFGVSVHPSTIQRALKRRRRTAATADPSPDPASA